VDNSYLIKHAIKNVWCAPDQDYQYIIELHRVTKLEGEANRVILFNRRIDLPVKNKRCHVFTADAIHPKYMKMLVDNPEWALDEWFNIGELINNTSIFMNIYNEKGIEIPKFQSWYTHTKEGALIFAFEENSKIPINYQSEVVYVRAYTNAIYSSVRDTGGEDTHYEYKIANDTNDILAIQTLYNTYSALNGYVYCYINGVYTNKIDLPRCNIGDVIEFIYDSSVAVVTSYRIGNLNSFTSTLDQAVKYLLLRNDNRNGVIDYYDDIDIHIVANIAPNVDKGLYFHRNNKKSIRMVTHRDYSILLDNVVYETIKLKDIVGPSYDNQDMLIELKIRNSGFDRPLIYEKNRLHELYKLSYSDRQAAMLGLNALSIWRAEVLENSDYVKLMDIAFKDFNLAAVEHAYGYNSISTILADTPTKTHFYSGWQRIILPPGLQSNSTFYEYDADGELIDMHYQVAGPEFLSTNPNTRLVEGIYGQATDTPDVYFGNDNLDIPTGCNYRVYMLIVGSPDGWKDVTNDIFYTIESGKLKNSNLIGNELFMIRTDKKFLALDLNLVAVAGTIYFDLAEIEDRGLGYQSYIMPVPMGELDIFLNGKSLIRGLDYFIEFPRIHIVNKEYLIQPAGSSIQNVKVRFTGFCNRDLSLDAIEDYGFVEHGFLSNNNRFDVRDDKVMRITVGGKLKTKADVEFSEEHLGINVTHVLNGRPYQIKDIVVPVTTYTVDNVYDLREQAIVTDKLIEDYLTLKLPQPPRVVPPAIPARYVLFSPFFSHIINDMATNIIDEASLSTITTNMDYVNFFKSYEPLLKFDPITKNLNDGFVVIHPHQLSNTINLSLLKMRVLTKLVSLYGDNKITLSPFVTL
jgi:hypothetical protein